MVENWAESATTLAPQTSAIASTSQTGPALAYAIISAQAPETIMASAALDVRPTLSLYAPAHHEPANPAAMTANAQSAAPAGSACPCRANVSARKTAIQPHIA